MARMQGLALPSGNRGLLIIAAIAGLAAAVLFVVAVNGNGSNTSSVSSGTLTGDAVIATKTISSGAVIRPDMVRATKIDGPLIPNVFSETDKVVGQVAKYEIPANDQINPSKVGAIASGSGFSSVPERGMRVASLKVSENTAVGGLLTPGDRVDIIGTFKIKDRSLPDGQYILRTRTILQNVEVLSVGQEHQEPLAARDLGNGGAASTTSGVVPADITQQADASTITLSLTPEQTQILFSTQETAKTVWASLRPIGDTDPVEISDHDVIAYE